MKRIAIAVAAIATLVSTAAASPMLVYDATYAEKFEIKREIVDRVQATFGEEVVFASGASLPEPIDAAIVPGRTMPEAAPRMAPPDRLGDLPRLGEDTQWVRSGPHLVEVADDGMIVMVVYDVLS